MFDLPTEHIRNYLDRFRKYIESVNWQTSKDKSHAYTIREWNPEFEKEFEGFTRFIRAYGRDEYFYGKAYKYLEVGDGFKYWTLGNPIEETTVINRVPLIGGLE